MYQLLIICQPCKKQQLFKMVQFSSRNQADITADGNGREVALLYFKIFPNRQEPDYQIQYLIQLSATFLHMRTVDGGEQR